MCGKSRVKPGFERLGQSIKFANYVLKELDKKGAVYVEGGKPTHRFHRHLASKVNITFKIVLNGIRYTKK